MLDYGKNRVNIAVFLPAVIILLYSAATIKRNPVWLDSYALWMDTVKKSPQSSRAHTCVGNALYEKGFMDKAILEYEESLRLFPRNFKARANLAVSYATEGRYEEAVKELKNTIESRPDATEYYNLGLVYLRMGKNPSAKDAFERALKIKPDFVPAIEALSEME